MPRADYVYVVRAGEPIAAFTVKHEMLSWLDRSYGSIHGLSFTRLPDGDTGTSVRHPVDITGEVESLFTPVRQPRRPKKPTRYCPWCGTHPRLKVDGSLTRHNYSGTHVPCVGSGMREDEQ